MTSLESIMPYSSGSGVTKDVSSWYQNQDRYHLNIKIMSMNRYFLNPLHAKFLRGNKNIYLHFMSFLHTDMTQAVEILP